MKRSKKYQDIIKNRQEQYTLIDALDKIKNLSISKFPAKIECHISLNLDTKNNNQILKGSVTYAHKVGNDKKILILTNENITNIKENNDIKIGSDKYIEKIKDGKIDFDILITTPDMMPQITSLGNILGPKSLMPNLKNGTITDDIEKTVNEYKRGKIDFKSDQTGTIHTIIGSVNNTKEELFSNLIVLLKGISVASVKPINSMIKSIYIAPTIGPSIKITVEEVLEKI